MNKFLFVVEGAKDEYRVLSCILKNFFGILDSEITHHHGQGEQIFKNSDVYVKTIMDANIEKFYNLLISDEYANGVSLASYFDQSGEYEYAFEYIIIDADLKDKVSGGKKELLLNLAAKVEKMENTTLLISSPQIEAISDTNELYKYEEGVKYKTHINNSLQLGAINHFIKYPLEILQMNIDKFAQVPYDEQAIDAIKQYNEETKEILIRCPMFHIIADYDF